MNEYLVSVVIPTYNRYEYLIPAVQSICRVSSPNLEIVIQDNTVDNTEILDFVNELKDDRVKYFHKSEHVSMSENCELGVQNSTGKYVCLIGDDDSVCEYLVTASKYCYDNRIDACMYPFPGFNWPDMTFEGGVKKEPNLFFMYPADGTVSKLDAFEILSHALKSAEGLPRLMPRAYHGLVSRSCLETVKSKCGCYFPGPSPDIANAVAVSLVAKKVVYLSDYLIISGYGYKSARGQGNRKQHYGRISEKPWLPKDAEDKWNPDIPKIFSGETIFAESLIQALRAMKREDLIKEYNYSALYALFLRHHKDSFGYMIGFCLKKPIRFFMLLKGVFWRLKFRKEILQNRKTLFKETQNIQSLFEAQEYTKLLRKEYVKDYVLTDDVITYGW